MGWHNSRQNTEVSGWLFQPFSLSFPHKMPEFLLLCITLWLWLPSQILLSSLSVTEALFQPMSMICDHVNDLRPPSLINIIHDLRSLFSGLFILTIHTILTRNHFLFKYDSSDFCDWTVQCLLETIIVQNYGQNYSVFELLGPLEPPKSALRGPILLAHKNSGHKQPRITRVRFLSQKKLSSTFWKCPFLTKIQVLKPF